MFDWLSNLLTTFAAVFPRITQVKKTHGAVKFVGARARPLKPGLHWFWPVTSEIVSLPVVRQSINLVTQVLLTRDRQPMVVSGIIVYRIFDIEAAIARSYDFESTIADVGLTALVEVITGRTLEELMAAVHADTFTADLTATTRRRLKPYGVRVLTAALTDFSTCRVLKLMGIGKE